MFLSKQITRPVAALADAMDEIADGKYEERVELVATAKWVSWCAHSITWLPILKPAGNLPRRLQHSLRRQSGYRRAPSRVGNDC